MRLDVDGMEIEVSEEVGAVLKVMLARAGRRADGLTQADVSRARFDAETLGAHRWGVTAGPSALALKADGTVDLKVARDRFDATTRNAWRWGSRSPA